MLFLFRFQLFNGKPFEEFFLSFLQSRLQRQRGEDFYRNGVDGSESMEQMYKLFFIQALSYLRIDNHPYEVSQRSVSRQGVYKAGHSLLFSFQWFKDNHYFRNISFSISQRTGVIILFNWKIIIQLILARFSPQRTRRTQR